MDRKDQLNPYLEAARPHYVGRDPGHDFRHIVRIAGRLDELSVDLEPQPIAHRLYFLCAFHGLERNLQNDPNLREKALEFLSDIGWAGSETDIVFKLLKTHLSDPKTPEQMIVHDANFFEVTGVFGIAKAFTVGGSRGQSYEETLAIFETNLDKLRFKTPMGRKKYAPRIEKARRFAEALRVELGSSNV